MRYQKVEGGYLVRLERGDDVIQGLAALMRSEAIGSGAVTGLGAVASARLGFYSVEAKGYTERRVEGEREVVGLTGTLSWFEGEPFPHVHLLLTGGDFTALGGHCFEAEVSATVEVVVRAFPGRVDRRRDEAIGLHLMDLSESCPLRPGDGAR